MQSGKGPSGTDYETLAVGVGIAGGLSATGLPIPVSVLAAKVLAVPATTVLNYITPLGSFFGPISNNSTPPTPILFSESDSPTTNPTEIPNPAYVQRYGGHAILGGAPQYIPNPNHVQFPKVYPGLKLWWTTTNPHALAGGTRYDYIQDPNWDVDMRYAPPVTISSPGFNPPPVLR